MWKTEKNFYVVRKWKKVWIFDSRNDCKESVNWFSDAKYKGFSSEEEAEIALNEWWEKYYGIKNIIKKKVNHEDIPFFAESIAVDAACSGNPWEMEYRWIDLKTWDEIFHEKFAIWTNNIWEFLAIVHWLKFLKDRKDIVIYSDSRIAISWVNQWKCKTKIDMNHENFESIIKAIKRAETWLKEHGINNKILKWNTEERWEIPADFWRK